MQIPLYNCYWCKCAWCVKRTSKECMDRCIRCILNDDFKLPMDCENFIEKTPETQSLWNEIQVCRHCKYKRFYKLVKAKTKDL